MEEAHDFNESLKYEQSSNPDFDRFFKDKLGAADSIERIPYDTEVNKKIQRSDIDAIIEIQNKKITVSQKDRKEIYTDLLIEFYSKYPHTKGWMDKSEAEFLAYKIPGKIYWINKKQLVDFYNKTLKNAIPDRFFDEVITKYPRRKGYLKKKINILGSVADISVVSAFNKPKDQPEEWYTVNICIGFDLLEKAGVDYKVFDFK